MDSGHAVVLDEISDAAVQAVRRGQQDRSIHIAGQAGYRDGIDQRVARSDEHCGNSSQTALFAGEIYRQPPGCVVAILASKLTDHVRGSVVVVIDLHLKRSVRGLGR